MPIPQESNPLLFGVLYFTHGARHVGLIAAVGADHAGGALAHRGAHAVHGGVAAAQHRHPVAAHVDVALIWFHSQMAVDVGDEIRQRLHYAGHGFAREAAFHCGVGAHP